MDESNSETDLNKTSFIPHSSSNLTKIDITTRSNKNSRNNEDDVIQQLLQHFASAFTKTIPASHLTVGCSNWIHVTQKEIRTLLIHKRLPDHSWSDHDIQYLLNTFATLDTNSKVPIQHQQSFAAKPRWVGVGEREGRVYSSLVLQRHCGLSHGIGRSGNLQDAQPKAVGSTLLAQLTNALALDVIQRGGSQLGGGAASSSLSSLIVPLCTGMSISLVLQSLRRTHRKPQKDIVLWSRIDQKSCYKAILAAGLQCILIPTKLVERKNSQARSSNESGEEENDDSVTTDLAALQAAIDTYGSHRILAVITTTSCFAPRVPDRVDQVAKLLLEHNHQSTTAGEPDCYIYHVINHAYGLQCSQTGKLINRACTIGQVDAIVCSLDKNFLVPVGGAMVLSPKPHIVSGVGKIYAGRATSTHIVDLFITLLSMGLTGYRHLYQQRLTLVPKFVRRFQEVATKYQERLLICPTNTISYAMTLDGLVRPRRSTGDDTVEEETEEQYLQSIERDLTQLGAMLFHRCISGTRVVARNVTQRLEEDAIFQGFGSSYHEYPHGYLTAACVIGMTEGEIEEFFVRLDKALLEFQKKQRKRR
jgi:O-phospho-L-seryl-tRNASec:L-selenocysteinyl-tRNA synthase